MPGSPQQSPIEMIQILQPYFQRRAEPQFAWKSAVSQFMELPGLRAFWPMSNISSPELHILLGDTGATADADADGLTVEESAVNAGISILTDDNRYSSVFFGSPTDAKGAYVQYIQSLAQMSVGTDIAAGDLRLLCGASNELMRLDGATGRIGVGDALASPQRLFHIEKSDGNPQMRLSYTASYYTDFYVDGGAPGFGDLTITPVGNNVILGDADLNIQTGRGIIHADGVAAGYVLLADGTRYIPANGATSLPVVPGARGHILRADATPAWTSYNAATDGAALVGNGLDIVSTLTPTWKGAHTHTADIIMNDGAANSPILQFIGGTNDDTIIVYLDDNAVAGDSDLVIRLCAADTGSQLIIQDSGLATVAYIDADGNADFAGHLAVGANATISTTTFISAVETHTSVAGEMFGAYIDVSFDPGANFATSVYAVSGRVQVGTAQARTAGLLTGVLGLARVDNGVAATNLNLAGVYGYCDVEDAGAVAARGGYFVTPYIDTGTCTSGYGIQIVQGPVGAGSITTLYGITIAAITAGNTNYAIYSAGGQSYHAGSLGIGVVAPPTKLSIAELETLGGNIADGYTSAITSDPSYTGAFTVTRHNYWDVNDVALAGGAALTDGAVMRFDAAIGTHCALAAGFNTTDSGADTTAWALGVIINVNGTLYKIPAVAV